MSSRGDFTIHHWTCGCSSSGNSHEQFLRHAEVCSFASTYSSRQQSSQRLTEQVATLTAENERLGERCVEWNEDFNDAKAELRQVEAERDALKAAMLKINAIRNDIIGRQAMSFSAHVYPLVAVLDKAGFVGADYETARENVLTLEQQNADLKAEVERLKVKLERLKPNREDFRLTESDIDRIINECGSGNDLSDCVKDLLLAHYMSFDNALSIISELQRENAELVKAISYQIEHGALGNGDIQKYTDACDLLAKHKATK